MRPDGFYWVKRHGRWYVSEWVGTWCVMCDENTYDDEHFDEIGKRIEEPFDGYPAERLVKSQYPNAKLHRGQIVVTTDNEPQKTLALSDFYSNAEDAWINAVEKMGLEHLLTEDRLT